MTSQAITHSVNTALKDALTTLDLATSPHPTLLGFRKGQNATIVDIASDGLTLQHKIHIERRVLGALVSRHGEETFQVNFRRSQPPAPSQTPPIPPSLRPLGVNFRRRAIANVTSIIAVASGKGGVGKSTVASHLAMALARNSRVGLVDTDIYGPSAPTMFGAKGPLPVTGNGKLLPISAHGVKLVSFGLLSEGSLPVLWRGPLIARAVEQLFFDVDWGPLDFLVVDLPPGTGDVQLTLLETVPVRGAVIVTTPQDVALVDARKAVAMFERLELPILGVVKNMARFDCPHCNHASALFAEDPEGLRLGGKKPLTLLGTLPLDLDLGRHCDEGHALSLEDPMGIEFESIASKIRNTLSPKVPD